ncbi:hypothetical protein SteCoe_25020 [Stentor coeruleus]|uniref:LsmAD domain-containing protein n=1 Tax=Stentor coeruleus TaxID=5963 RepID=A0A1R2BG50_9CILI|nr:hypothetical protein SteCoe_25020 [Stentor coeruleus]
MHFSPVISQSQLKCNNINKDPESKKTSISEKYFKSQKISHADKIMKQRTLWAMLSTLSRACSVKKSDNSKISGLIHTLCKKGVILINKTKSEAEKIMIPFDTIISLECLKVQNTHKFYFQTDKEISKQSKAKKRQLQQWEGDEIESLAFDTKEYKGWNQFETNTIKFGVVSTYDENLYTTPIPHISELTKEQIIRAKIVEKELNAFAQEKDEKEEEDEEAMFGAVLGSGRYADSKLEVAKKKQKRSELKKKRKKNRKVFEIGKKNEMANCSDDKLENLSFPLPFHSAKNTDLSIINSIFEAKNNNKSNLESSNPSLEKANFKLDTSEKPHTHISFISHEKPRVPNLSPIVEFPKQEFRSIIDIYIITWKKYINHN